MPLISGLRILNGLSVGNVSGSCLETLLQSDSKRGDFTSIIQSPGYACLLGGSNTATHAVTRSNTALDEIFFDVVPSCVLLSTAEFANSYAYSGCAFNHALTSDYALCRFSNSALTIGCSFSSGTTFSNCVTSSNTNLQRFISCPVLACCVFRTCSSMLSLANNSNIAAYLYSDPTGSSCFFNLGGQTAMCHSFNAKAWVDFGLQPGITQDFLRNESIGNFAFSVPLSSYCYVRDACVLETLFTSPACGALLTSCFFACFGASTYGIPCATTEINSGNTTFLTCLYGGNACRQYYCVANNSSFMQAVYAGSYSNLFNCMWFGGASCCQGSAPCCDRCFTQLQTCYPLNRNSACRIRVARLCDYGANPCDVSFLSCASGVNAEPFTTSNNGNFIMFSVGTLDSKCPRIASKTWYIDCISRSNTEIGACGFLWDKGIFWSNDQGITWCKLCFTLPTSFFRCQFFTNCWNVVCCNGSDACDQYGVAVTSAWTCANTFWIGWTSFPTDLWITMSGHVYGCIGANNVPIIKSIQPCAPIPTHLVQWCCGFFHGIGHDCAVQCRCFCHGNCNCRYWSSTYMTQIVGRLCCECGAPTMRRIACNCAMTSGLYCNQFCACACTNCPSDNCVPRDYFAGETSFNRCGSVGAPIGIMLQCSCCPTERIKSIFLGFGARTAVCNKATCCDCTAGISSIIEYCTTANSCYEFREACVRIASYGGAWAVANMLYIVCASHGCGASYNCCFGMPGNRIAGYQLGNREACTMGISGGGVCGTTFYCYTGACICNWCCSMPPSSFDLQVEYWSRQVSVYVDQQNCNFVLYYPGDSCVGYLGVMSPPPGNPFYANNAPLQCIERARDICCADCGTWQAGCLSYPCAGGWTFHRPGTFEAFCGAAIVNMFTTDCNSCCKITIFPKSYATFGNASSCPAAVYAYGSEINPTCSGWACRLGFAGYPNLANEGVYENRFTSSCQNFTGIKCFTSCCFLSAGEVNCPQHQLIPTPKGYPTMPGTRTMCGTGFYANGASFTACDLAIKFIDIF